MSGKREGEAKGPSRAGKCPICGRPSVERWRPFCSARCQHIDLGRWLGEAYRIPGAEAPPEAEPGAEKGEE